MLRETVNYFYQFINKLVEMIFLHKKLIKIIFTNLLIYIKSYIKKKRFSIE